MQFGFREIRNNGGRSFKENVKNSFFLISSKSSLKSVHKYFPICPYFYKETHDGHAEG